MNTTGSTLTHLQCSKCDIEYSKDSKITLNNSLVLDLFAGTGSFGLECISRGSTKVYFVENYPQSIEILDKLQTLLIYP